MTKILVTGATGRLGGQVVEFLLRRVTGVTNNQTSAFHRGCAKTQMRDRRMVGQLAIFDCRISTDVLSSMSF